MKKAQGANGGATSEGSGISIVSFITENQEKAEDLASRLLKSGLIADVEIISGGYERFYLKDNKELIDDSLVKMKIITADYKVPQLMTYIKENNPNEHTKQVQLLATQMTGGNKDYIHWVKSHFMVNKPADLAAIQQSEEAAKEKKEEEKKKEKSKEFEKKFDLVQSKDTSTDPDEDENFEFFDN